MNTAFYIFIQLVLWVGLLVGLMGVLFSKDIHMQLEGIAMMLFSGILILESKK